MISAFFRAEVQAVQASAPAPVAAPNKPDLTKWKYAELRDTINTSTGKMNKCPVFLPSI